MLQCGLLRSNFSFAMTASQLLAQIMLRVGYACARKWILVKNQVK
jgi:hypothetical protein